MIWSAANRSRTARAVVAGAVTALSLVGAAFQTGCSQNTVTLPSRNLDRPTDMTFACLGKFTDPNDRNHVIAVGGQPMGKCHPPGILDPKHGTVERITDADMNPLYDAEYRTYAFVTNAARGDLSVIDMSYCRPDDTTCAPPGAKNVDLDPSTTGYGVAPLGELPEVITASQDGCRVVSANRGSCDFSFISPAALLFSTVGGAPPVATDAGTTPVVPGYGVSYSRTVVPRTDTGRLAVAPGEIAFVPQQTMSLTGTRDVCDPAGVEGTLAAPVGAAAATAAAPAAWRAVVTFPSCDLVALLDLPSGNILDSFVVKAGDTGYAYVHTGTNPVCPVADCPGGAGVVPPADGGADAGVDGAAQTDADDDSTAGDAATTDDANAPDAVDAGPAPVIVTVTTNLSVGALAMHPDGNRVYFGAANARFVGALDITGMGDRFSVPANGGSTRLAGGANSATALGVTRLRASVDPYAYSKAHDAFVASGMTDPAAAARPEFGRFVAGKHDDQPADPLEFLYVIATDGSVRVVDIARSAPVECDLGIDPYDPKALAVGDDDSTRAACFEYQAPDGPRRLLYAGGPGMRFGSPAQDVAFANYRTPHRAKVADSSGALNTPDPLDEQVLSGAFAFVMTSGGNVYIVNIDPELRLIAQVQGSSSPGSGNPIVDAFPESPRPLTNSRRDNNVITYSTVLGPQNGPPRLDAAPIALIDGVNLKKFTTFDSRINATFVPTRPLGPRSIPVLPADTYVYFPNRATATPQTWTITWEGDVTGVRITGDIAGPSALETPPLLTPPLSTKITDNGAGFCLLGGVDGDVMTLVGCDTDATCAPANVCVHSTRGVPPSVDGHPITGLCLRRDFATQLRDDVQCRRMLETFRRYEIVSSDDASTIVVPRRAEVPRPAFLDGDQLVACTVANNNQGDLKGCQPEMSPVHANFQCVTVTVRPDGSPLHAGDLRRRCLQKCDTDNACGPGRVCVDFPPDGKFCAEGGPIAAGCGFDQLFSYKISAGGAFVVAGSAAGRTEIIRPRQTDQGPECVIDPAFAAAAASSPPELVSRIPLNSPLCDAASLPDLTKDMMGNDVRKWDDTFLSRPTAPRPNPCFVVEENPHVVSALFQNTELRFVLTDLQQPIPNVVQLRFDVHGGFAQQVVIPALDANPGLPARILLGPIPADPTPTVVKTPGDPIPTEPDAAGIFSDLPYLFVVDQRAFSAGRLGVRGQILRITPRAEITSAPFPAFEGFTGSGRYFPVQ